MYVNLGGEIVITSSEIVALVDLTGDDRNTGWQSWPDLIMIDIDDHKTLVITTSHHYLSPISVSTLKKRMQTIMEERK